MTIYIVQGRYSQQGLKGLVDRPEDRQAEVKALVELRVPFELNRQQIDDVERGANDSDWQPAKDAAQKIAYAEDRAIFEGYPAAGISGIRPFAAGPDLAGLAAAPPSLDSVREDITRLPPHVRTRRGIARSFQIPRPFRSASSIHSCLNRASSSLRARHNICRANSRSCRVHRRA